MLDDSNRKTKRTVDGTKLLGIASCEVIVDGHDVYRASGECGCNCGQQRRQRLALASLHFGEAARHQRSAAEQLNVEMAHARMSARGLSCERKSKGYVV